MSELSLVLSEKFAEDDATSIRDALSRHLQVGKPMPLRGSHDSCNNALRERRSFWTTCGRDPAGACATGCLV